MADFSPLIAEVNERFHLGEKAQSLLKSLLAAIYLPPIGGMSTFLDLFRKKIPADTVASWVGGTTSLPLSEENLTLALGEETLNNISSDASLSAQEARPALAMMVPRVVRELSPNGMILAGIPSAAYPYLQDRLAIAQVSPTMGRKQRDSEDLKYFGLVSLGVLLLSLVGWYAMSGGKFSTPTLTGTTNEVAHASHPPKSPTDTTHTEGDTHQQPTVGQPAVTTPGATAPHSDSTHTPPTDGTGASTETTGTKPTEGTGATGDGHGSATSGDTPVSSTPSTQPGDSEQPTDAAVPPPTEPKQDEPKQEEPKQEEPKEEPTKTTIEEKKKVAADITLRNVHFLTGSAKIQPKSQKVLASVAEILKTKVPDAKFEIQGHTDNVGNEAENLALSQLRADAVRNFLGRKGVATSRLQVKGFGSSKPVATNANEQGRAKNRRIEYKVIE